MNPTDFVYFRVAVSDDTPERLDADNDDGAKKITGAERTR